MLPKTLHEEDLHGMFGAYGDLREVHLIRGPDGASKGCAFVKYVERESCLIAIEDLNDVVPVVSENCFWGGCGVCLVH